MGTDSGKPTKVPTINRNGCPRSIGITVHDQTEWVPTMPRNTQINSPWSTNPDCAVMGSSVAASLKGSTVRAIFFIGPSCKSPGW
ncbi:hypothetical protein AFE_1381 [Acidithiobacillus ferrooxidans ATCC 23270]|uniref:Uncharacterized protein n=1 Tax=Acidithiobacillus ferrooxidans (strain ATCC 23270 / DSM 14882 / CIP 104768 / NCIMB 8455) TaxID=243159 RepID=B7J9I2_ACIF2|nr:hypothetical protein AFE_1381 [Acidithiobacillus ferrooxidans ATCC 23270]